MIDETIRLTSDNKVNIKNAFDVDINCIDTLTQLIAGKEQPENTWGRTGEALGAGAKIYGYRVDNVHMETYKILGGLHRHGIDQEIELIGGEGGGVEQGEDIKEEEDEKEQSEKKRKKRMLKFTDGQGEKTLDKPENLVIDANFDTEAMVDPLFK